MGARLDSLANHQNRIDSLGQAPGGVSSDFDDPLAQEFTLSKSDVSKLLPDY